MYLIIGGTKFLGRHLADSLLARGHEVTLFNRGKHPAGNMPDVEVVRGDRYRDLDRLAGRKWEAVIDTCGYLPRNLTATAEFLAPHTDRYIFISSISAYADFSRPNFDETTPLVEWSGDQEQRAEEIDTSGEMNAIALKDLYGVLKSRCERAVEEAMPGRVLIIRPGLIVGPYDSVDRFTYWVTRTARGGEVLAPGRPDRFVQLIDARDLADWTVRMAERGETGIYNTTGKPFDLSMGNMLGEIKVATGSDASFTWVDEEFLAWEEVSPWSEMPFYLPESAQVSRGLLSVNIDRALGSGLIFRPLAGTIVDTLNWWKTRDTATALKAGISAERETELLNKFHHRIN